MLNRRSFYPPLTAYGSPRGATKSGKKYRFYMVRRSYLENPYRKRDEQANQNLNRFSGGYSENLLPLQPTIEGAPRKLKKVAN